MAYTPAQYVEDLMVESKAMPLETVTTAGLGTMASFWSGATPPTGGRQCDQSTDGARWPVSAADTWRIGRLKTAGSPGNIFLYDRLCDQSGIQPNSTGLQAVTLPALPRYADGLMVEAFLENLVTFSGSGPANMTINYVNELGASKVSVMSFAGIGTPVKRLHPISLAPGDKGFRTITSVQLDVAYTSVGNIGIVLARRLALAPQATTAVGTVMPPSNEVNAFRGGLPKVLPNACLWAVGLGHTTTVGGVMLEYALIKTQ